MAKSNKQDPTHAIALGNFPDEHSYIRLPAPCQYTRYPQSTRPNREYRSNIIRKLKENGYEYTWGNVAVKLKEAYDLCWGVELAVLIAHEARKQFPTEKISITMKLFTTPTINQSRRRKIQLIPLLNTHMPVPSGNYASALYITAVKANVLDKVKSELLTLVEASKRSPMFSQLMKDFSVTADMRVKAINGFCAQAKFTDITKNFLALVFNLYSGWKCLQNIPPKNDKNQKPKEIETTYQNPFQPKETKRNIPEESAGPNPLNPFTAQVAP
ncbi:unnamed protein product [Fraxinus pennsylvanica]|uniref:Uncharacterized protein n=1 Tax=Fraxinus pennsylvanica TaxID=56036 RepID=A0AAD2E6R4_9LAMI|nr:unnamed protein product [Fraxinus pennsylvanica]